MTLAILLASFSALAAAQTVAEPPSYMVSAHINVIEGVLQISGSSPRPLLQASEAVRRHYGWAVAYEEAKPSPNLYVSDPARGLHLAGAAFTWRLREPADNSATEKRRFLQDLVSQYEAQSGIRYKLISLSDGPVDLIPDYGTILDQPVQVDSLTRSLRGNQRHSGCLSKSAGIKVVQGGLMYNDMEQTQVSLHHSGAVAARMLLVEVLSHARGLKTWGLSFEPNGGFYALGIQPVEQWITDADGKTHVRPVWNQALPAPAR